MQWLFGQVNLVEILIVCEYSKVSIEYLLGLSPDREIKFTIDILPRIRSIPKTP